MFICLLCCVCVLSSSAVSNSLLPRGLQPARLLCSQNSPGKNTRAGCHALPQGNLPNPRIELTSPALQIFLTTEQLGKPLICLLCLVTQSCLTLFNPMNCSPPGSSVHGLSQARLLEWVAISSGIFPTQGSNPHLWSLLHWQADFLRLHHLGSPIYGLLLLLSNFSRVRPCVTP